MCKSIDVLYFRHTHNGESQAIIVFLILSLKYQCVEWMDSTLYKQPVFLRAGGRDVLGLSVFLFSLEIVQRAKEKRQSFAFFLYIFPILFGKV